MTVTPDPALVAFLGSETRARTLGVLANAEFPMTGYRVAVVAGVPRSRVYRELRRAIEAGIVRIEKDGYRLIDPDFRILLRKRIRWSWSEDWARKYDDRTKAAQRRLGEIDALSPIDYSRYTPNPVVARRYAREFERPGVKDDWPAKVTGDRVSRKRL